MKINFDVDIDVGNRDLILEKIKHVPASMRNITPIRKHASGIYPCNIPYDPVNAMAAISYETAEERGARQEANSLRAGAKNRSYRDQPCYLCSETSHSVAKCGLLPSDEFEQLDIFRKAAARIPWYVS